MRDGWIEFHVNSSEGGRERGGREKEMLEAMVKGSFRAWDEVGGAWAEVFRVVVEGEEEEGEEEGMEVDD